MAGELNINKCRLRMNCPIELLKKVTKEFAKPGDTSETQAVVRALEEATRDVLLTKKEYAEIGKIVEQNLALRMERREERKSWSGVARSASSKNAKNSKNSKLAE